MFAVAAKQSLFGVIPIIGDDGTPDSSSADVDRCFIGQLTEAGYLQHMNNGFRMREAYGRMEGKDLAAWADREDRTQESAKALLSGLVVDGRQSVLHTNPILVIVQHPNMNAWGWDHPIMFGCCLENISFALKF